jgi:hypothetical protein
MPDRRRYQPVRIVGVEDVQVPQRPAGLLADGLERILDALSRDVARLQAIVKRTSNSSSGTARSGARPSSRRGTFLEVSGILVRRRAYAKNET